jgi:sialate O-acetylesterase
MKTPFLTFLLAIVVFTANAQLSTAKLFGNNMVLQRKQDVPVWGWTEKNAKVLVGFNGQAVSVKADETGYWKAILKPMEAGGPFVMTVASGKDHLLFTDVMVGEVWICGGQSNMEFQLKNAYGYGIEKKVAADQQIRQFRVPDKISLQPEKDIAGGEWIKADTGTVGDFTAVGYFFAKKLAENLHVTVGLVYSNWGGTDVEDWISRDAMLASPELAPVAKTLPINWDEMKARIDKQLREWAYNKQPVINYTVEQLAAKPASFFESWQRANAPGAWMWTGKLYSFRGEGFTEKTIKLDEAYATRASVIRLGTTDADMVMYINGKLIKKGNLPGNFQLDLPAGTWKGGDNSILIDFTSGQKNPSYMGLGITGVGNDIYVKFADTTVNMADGNWHVLPDLSKPYHFDFLPNNSACMLYNAMINPLIPYGIAGVIWYQGEANTNRAYQYRTSFPLMITDWRNRWKQQFPFLFVQLSSFGGFQNSNYGSGWAELREAQSITLQLPNTGMAVTTDIGDPLNIHPKDKADVGYRLAAKALTMTYKLPGFRESPLYANADFSGSAATVTFTHAESGLMAKDKYGYIEGFEVAGADHKFYYAQATITADNKVKVFSSQVPQPVAVRYGWTDAPVEANLFNKAGFPVSAFRSDNWKGFSEGKGYE